MDQTVETSSVATLNLSECDDTKFCIKKLLDHSKSLSNKFNKIIYITCSHTSNDQTSNDILFYLFIAFLVIFSIFSWLVIIAILPIEKTLPYCSGYIYKSNGHPANYMFHLLSYFGFNLFFVIFLFCLKLKASRFHCEDDKVDHEKMKTLSLIRFCARIGTGCYFFTIFIFFPAYIFTKRYPIMAENSGSYLGGFCSSIISISIACTDWLLFSFPLMITLILIVHYRFESLFEEIYFLPMKRNLSSDEVKNIQMKYKNIVLEVEQINDIFSILVSAFDVFIVSFIAIIAIIILHTNMEGKFLYYILLISFTASLIIFFLTTALISSSARKCMIETRIFDSLEMDLLNKIRLLSFAKRLGSEDIGIQVLDFILTKRNSIRVFKTIISFFGTLNKLNKIRDKEECIYANNTNTLNLMMKEF